MTTQKVYAVELRDKPGMYLCPAAGGDDPMPQGAIMAWALAQNIRVLFQHNPAPATDAPLSADMLGKLWTLVDLWEIYITFEAHDIDPPNEHPPGYTDGWREAFAHAAAVLKITLGDPPATDGNKTEL